MNDRRFRIHRRALTSYSILTPRERNALDAALDRLVDLPESRWPTAGAVRLELAEPVYLVRVDKSLRAFVEPAPGGQPELSDLVRQETLDRFFKNSATTGGRA
jgi:hypothetical protein